MAEMKAPMSEEPKVASRDENMAAMMAAMKVEQRAAGKAATWEKTTEKTLAVESVM